MSYNVYKTDGNLLTIVNDGAINSSTSLNLVGIGYNAYAESIAESLVHLMENFSSLTPPTSPIVGQLWWDAVNHRLNIYDGTVFKAINNINVSATAPVSDTFGDYWYDTVNNQLKFFTLTGWLVIAPAYTTNQGVSGQIVNTLTDTQGLSHTVTSLYNANNLIAAIVTEPFSTYNLPGLYTVKNGINLAAGYELNGTVSIARESLGLTANADVNYMHSNTNTSTIGIVTVNNDGGLVVGVTSPISLFYDSPSNNWNFTPTTSNLTIGGGGTSAVINVNQNGWVGINTLNPLYDLDVQDDIGLSGNIYLESTATTYPGLVWDYNSGVGLLNGTSLNLYNNKSSISLDASTNIITLSSMFINGNTATNDLFNSTSTVSANKILGFTVGNSSTALVGNTLAATNMTAMLLSATTVNAATIGNTGAVFNGDKIVVNTINAGLIGNSNSTQLQGTLITQAQGNITSLGLLTGLTSVGTIAAATMNAGVIGNTGAALRGATATLTGAVAANTYTGVAINAGTIGNAGAAIVGATVTTTGLISTTSTATASTMNAATLNATTINATQESVTTLNVGTVITSPLVNAATIGNSGAAIVGATSTMSGPSKAASYTATGGGQVSGYFTGIIGANVPNIAYFSTVYITSNQTTFGLVNAPTINAASIGNAGTAYTGSTLSLTNSVTAPTLTGTTVSGAAVTGATIGNSGSQLSGASATLTGTVSAPTVSGAAVTGATIGNSGSRLSGASATLTGTVSAPTVSGSTVTGATIGNTGAVFTGSSINLTGAVIASGTISAPTINAGTIGNSGATFTGATLTTTSDITTSGNVVVATAPTSGNHATNKTYVDAKVLSAQLPVGTVIMWYGSLGSLPTGYHLCDGTSGTPDLRDRFVYGAGGTVTIGATGGNNSISTTTASAGGHFHTASTTSTGIHSHSITINGVPAHTHDFYDVYGIDDDDGGGGSVGNYNIINGVPTYYPYNTASGLGLSPSALSNRPSAPTTILSDADGRPVQPSLYYRQGSPQGNGYEFFYQNGEGSTDPSFSTGQDHATFAFKNRTLSTGTGGGITSTTDAGGAHNHTSLTDTAAAHTHGVSFDNTPAWTALAYIMRIS